jgi:uncharacterized membrane protein
MAFIFKLLLSIHILAGFTSLTSACGAILTKKGAYFHRLFGKIFVGGMTIIFITAIPLSLIRQDLFLFLIAFFSYYFALSGFMFARNQNSQASRFSWLIAFMMLGIGMTMLSYSIYHIHDQRYQNIVLLVFGILSCSTSVSDLKSYYYQTATGSERIVKHLTAMLGATIATLTAFTVVNIQTNPEYIAWIAPTILILPLIIWWTRKVRQW